MKQILLSLIQGIITSGLKTLLYLHKQKHGEQKNTQLKGTILQVVTALQPIAQETNTTIDNSIIDILTDAIS